MFRAGFGPELVSLKRKPEVFSCVNIVTPLRNNNNHPAMPFLRKTILKVFGQGHKLKDPHGRNNREEIERQANSAPRALPPTRPRALSRLAAADQLQSLFFGRLSAELRNIIYEEVLAGHRDLHLANMHQRLGCIRCFQHDDGVPGWKHDCWGWCYLDGTHRGPLPGQPSGSSLLPLLLACRRT